MALATCKDCNREVSTRARHCVHCGRPSPAGHCAGSIVGGIAVVVIALALTGGMICAAKRACHKISRGTCVEERVSGRPWNCSDAPRDVDKAAFIKALEKDGARLTEVKPNLYQLTPAPEVRKEESR
jgi:hypothetical protein